MADGAEWRVVMEVREKEASEVKRGAQASEKQKEIRGGGQTPT
jgi:hypothetical protein